MTDIVRNEPRRGGCLTVFLVMMVILNLLSSVYYVFLGPGLRQALPSLPAWAVPVLAIAGLANTVFAFGVWRWKRWGVYGFGVTTLVAFVINFISVGPVAALLGLIGLVLLIFLIRNAWVQMD